MTDDTTVWIKRCRNGETADTYHTDADCRNLPTDPRAITAAQAEKKWLEICAYCDDAVEWGERTRSLREQIEAGEINV